MNEWLILLKLYRMARTETTSIPLGFQAPSFSLPEPRTGRMVSLQEVSGEKATVVMFICNHCPYVIHVREALIALAEAYRQSGVYFIAISSNDVENYPQDSPELMAQLAEEMNFPFPYLFDEDQSVAKAYYAACTPDFSVFDAKLKCVYRGRMDGSTPGNDVPVTGADLRQALDDLLEGRSVSELQLPSIGCNIKWKA